VFFFRRGVMDASFNGDGRDLDMKEVLMILVIRGMMIFLAGFKEL